ncbi:substrate-binding domain-containing protein [Blastochloris sulfoviridis]|uniref:Phosphatase n=1 Tax=Blastochloris sulfoviridis TaxID=50712 RepID=A0A5M6I737_9HYPH|nr:substrate-binding domain-containing protein [Blastochloris sulfoviridis]KAA5603697.1 phosphatase [Blastochloris sulfoviridis]
MKNWKSCLMATVAVTCFGAVESANAQVIYGGGATFPAPLYRQLFDCVTVRADLPSPMAYAAGCPIQNPPYPYLMLYAPVGSSKGKKALAMHDASQLGTPSSSNTVPYKSSRQPTPGQFPYPSFHFAGSDDPWLATDQALYETNGGLANYGRIIQIPAVIGPVTIAFNGKDGAGNALNITNPTPTGGTSGLNLSRKAMCGIFSGHITQWDNPILTADNGGTALGTGPITVVHRAEGSGTNFLMTSALAAQCGSEFGPTNESNPALTLYEFPWSDNTVAASQCPALPYRGSNKNNWPDAGAVDQCSAAISNPGGGTFVAGQGNSGVVAAIASTNGAIGYSTSDYVKPVVPTGLATANLQSEADLGSTTWTPPTAAAAAIGMQSASPVFTAATRTNPLNWSLQAVAANPKLSGAYPLVGFSFFDLYQCYASATNASVIKQYLQWHYSSGAASAVIQANGFALPPQNWLMEIQALAFGADGINVGGSGNCAGKPGA